jgi:hypothetical protein
MKLDIPKLEIREECYESFLVWVFPDGEDGAYLDLACIKDPNKLAELQTLAKDGKLYEMGAVDLAGHYAAQEILDQKVPYTSNKQKEFVFEETYLAKAALRAANKGLARAKLEIKAGLSKNKKEPYWAPLALAAGWTPPK